MQKKRKIMFKKENIPLWLMALPTVLWLIFFAYIPMSGLVLAFKKYHARKGMFGSDWVGFKNFEYLFTSTDTPLIVRNTIGYNLVFIFLGTIVAVVMAILLGEIHSKRTAKVYQTIYMMPYFLSWAVVTLLVEGFLSRGRGLINGVMGTNIDWYARIDIWPPLLVLIYLWKSVGYNAVLYLAVISGISQEYYEAAMLDGATRFQQARYITVPHLKMVISLTIITAMGGIFRGDFGLFYLVTRNTGTLYPVTSVIDTYIYNGLQNQSNLGITTASGLFQSVVGFVTLVTVNKIVSKIDSDNALF